MPDDLLALYLAGLGQIALLAPGDESRLAKQIEKGRAAERRLATDGNLDEATTADLRGQADEGRQALERFVTANLRLVVTEAAKWTRRSHLGLDELIQEGNLGLIRAVEKFDWRRDVKFSTYAVWWIRKALQRGTAEKERAIRLPSGLHGNLLKVRAARTRLRAERGRPPCLEELAEATHLTENQVRQAISADFAVLSIDKPVSETDPDDDVGGIVVHAADSPADEVVERLFVEGVLETARCELPARNWYVLCRRYGLEGQEPATLAELGEELGISGETVRSLQQQGLGQLRRAIQRQLAGEGAPTRQPSAPSDPAVTVPAAWSDQVAPWEAEPGATVVLSQDEAEGAEIPAGLVVTAGGR